MRSPSTEPAAEGARLRELRRARLVAGYAEAANDPDYALEMAELVIEADVAAADGLA
jgi:hypothetical protein